MAKKQATEKKVSESKADKLDEYSEVIKKLKESVCHYKNFLSDISDIFICPISLGIPSDPIVSSTGIIYSQESIGTFKTLFLGVVCPVTNRVIMHFYKSLAVKQACEKLIEFENAKET